jgi:two-component system nitrate/nitrite response regulator NarL
MEIIECLIGGQSNKQIARSTNLSEATVKAHLKSILRKLRLQNRTQVAIWGFHQGVI